MALIRRVPPTVSYVEASRIAASFAAQIRRPDNAVRPRGGSGADSASAEQLGHDWMV